MIAPDPDARASADRAGTPDPAVARRQILFLHPSDELYGADRMLLEMLAALPSDVGAEVWVPTDLEHPADGQSLCGELKARGISVRHVDLPILRRAYTNPRGAFQLLRRARSLVRELRKDRPGVVYCTTSAAFLGAPLARVARVPRVVGHVQEIWSATDRHVLTVPALACGTLLCISESVRDALPRPVRRRAVVVPNGTGQPTPVPTTSRTSPTGPLRFLVASRWNGWKGHGTLLDAWNRAGAPGHLVVLGGPPRSGDSVDVHALVAALDDPASVTVVGEVADSSQEYERTDVVLIPSDQPEPFGLVAIEAFAWGRPVIGSAGGGLLEIVTPDWDGWLFPAQDVAALAGLLGSITRDDVTIAGERARDTFARRFTAAAFAEKWRAAVLGAPR